MCEHFVFFAILLCDPLALQRCDALSNIISMYAIALLFLTLS